MTFVPIHRAGFGHVERFALRHSFDDIDENNITQTLLREKESSCGANIAGADDGNFHNV
jgi:hypothetical protein